MTQLFKAIYFPDYESKNQETKSFTMAFSEKDMDLYEILKNMSSLEIRSLLSVYSISELQEQAEKEHLPLNTFCLWKIRKNIQKKQKKNVLKSQLSLLDVIDPIQVTFEGGKKLPLQSWYPYLEGYSPAFVEYIIDNFLDDNVKTIYDPFSGSGTTPLVASERKYISYYSEVNPLLQFLMKTKFQARNTKSKEKIVESLKDIKINLIKLVKNNNEDEELKKAYFNTFKKSKFFEDDTFSNILRIKTYIKILNKKSQLVSDLVCVAVLGSLIKSSLLKRQGDLRFKTKDELNKGKIPDFFETVSDGIDNIINDLKVIKKCSEPELITENAKEIGNINKIKIDAVITSPPYLNGTNYFRNTKMELWFLGHLKKLEDLTEFRSKAITAGINDVSLKKDKEIENEILKELLERISRNAYDKRIPKMIHDYFSDMKMVFSGLRKHLSNDATLAIDLGDSIYNNVHVKTDEILISIMQELGYVLKDNITLRRRISKNSEELKQVLLIFGFKKTEELHENGRINSSNKYFWEDPWKDFKDTLPHQKPPFCKRNWGDPIHSLCSYQGKLKPSIANMLTSIFVPPKGRVLDIFSGVGTIPLEAALQGKKAYGFDISIPAVAISRAKLSKISKEKTYKIISNLDNYIKNTKVNSLSLEKAKNFGLNKKLVDYFHPKTLEEIVLAREYFLKNGFESPEQSLVLAATLHILHGNRPYALSRRSHGITPFAPTGEFIYKNLIEKLKEKIERTLKNFNKDIFEEGESILQDSLKIWPDRVTNLDAIITSPPFFESTRFYSANWMRIWFAGWEEENFKKDTDQYIEEIQRKDLTIYENIFKQASKKIKPNGVLVFHLGKSKKCNMAKELSVIASKWFNTYDIFEESVRNGESHGVTDKGSVVEHQFLILTLK